jgi:glycosyltransferase involved in cell wall biosynthesis
VTRVTAAGPQLGALLARHRTNADVQIIPMAADQPDFRPMDRAKCRQRFGLPRDGILIGYIGSAYRNRGVETLFAAFRRLQRGNPAVRLICSGRREKGLAAPENVEWLGYLQDGEIPYLLNCMNVAVVTNKPTAFGSYSYPVKLYEAMTCHLPVVATETPAAAWILAGRPECLVRPGDPVDLAQKIGGLLSRDRIDYGELPDWQHCSLLLERALDRPG